MCRHVLWLVVGVASVEAAQVKLIATTGGSSLVFTAEDTDDTLECVGTPGPGEASLSCTGSIVATDFVDSSGASSVAQIAELKERVAQLEAAIANQPNVAQLQAQMAYVLKTVAIITPPPSTPPLPPSPPPTAPPPIGRWSTNSNGAYSISNTYATKVAGMGYWGQCAFIDLVMGPTDRYSVDIENLSVQNEQLGIMNAVTAPAPGTQYGYFSSDESGKAFGFGDGDCCAVTHQIVTLDFDGPADRLCLYKSDAAEAHLCKDISPHGMEWVFGLCMYSHNGGSSMRIREAYPAHEGFKKLRVEE